MKISLWGSVVNLSMTPETFPSEDYRKEQDKLLFNPTHGYFDTSNGKLHYLKYLPKGKPKALFVWQHGIHSHTGQGYKLSDDDYTNMALLSRMLVKHDIALYAVDLLGHGYSEGDRFYIPNGDWTINRDNLDSFAKFSASQHESKIPIFLGGESYGANICLHVTRKWQDDPSNSPPGFYGLSILSPAIDGDFPPAFIVFILDKILKPFFPTWTPFFMPNPVSADRIWKNEDVRSHYMSVKQRGLGAPGRKFCLGTASGLLSAMTVVKEKIIPGLKVPFCVAHGTHDIAVPISGTDYLLKHSTTPENERAVRKVENAYHDLMSEVTKEETLQFVIDWITDRIEKNPFFSKT